MYLVPILTIISHRGDVLAAFSSTTSPVTIENPQTGTSEQVANKLPTSSQRLLCFST